VPPANHPPKTRHRSRRSKELPFGENTYVSSSTPHNNFTSGDHTASSSPCSSDQQIESEPQTPNIKKRSRISLDTSIEDCHANKRSRNDSLTGTTDVKVESPNQSPIHQALHYSGLHDLDHLDTLPHSNSASLWPIVHDYTSTANPFYSALHNTNNDFAAYDAWNNAAFEFQHYNIHLSSNQFGEALHAGQQHESMSVRRHTNLDFMPLSAS
jgi:hypothetical protein